MSDNSNAWIYWRQVENHYFVFPDFGKKKVWSNCSKASNHFEKGSNPTVKRVGKGRADYAKAVQGQQSPCGIFANRIRRKPFFCSRGNGKLGKDTCFSEAVAVLTLAEGDPVDQVRASAFCSLLSLKTKADIHVHRVFQLKRLFQSGNQP